MTTNSSEDGPGLSRRRLLTTGACLGVSSLAGCILSGGNSDGETQSTGTPTETLPINSNYTRETLDRDPELARWKTTVGEEVNAGPVVAGDTVVVLADDSELVGLSRADGTESWRYSLDGKVIGEIATDGQSIYVAKFGGLVQSIDISSQTQNWETAVNPSGFVSTPRYYEGCLYLQAAFKHDETETYVNQIYSLSTLDGTVEWEATPPGTSVLAPVVRDNTVYYAGEQLTAYAAESGEQQWQFAPDMPIDDVPVVTDDTIVVPGSELVVYDLATRDRRWSKPFAETYISIALTADEKRVYVDDRDYKFSAYTLSSGTKSWTFETQVSSNVEDVLVGSEAVYVAASYVYALDPETGESKWTYPPGLRVKNITKRSDTVFGGTIGGEVFALPKSDP